MYIDSDQPLLCQACKNDIAPHEDKIILGAQLYGSQRYFSFHQPCWNNSRLINAALFTKRFLQRTTTSQIITTTTLSEQYRKAAAQTLEHIKNHPPFT